MSTHQLLPLLTVSGQACDICYTDYQGDVNVHVLETSAQLFHLSVIAHVAC